MRAEALTLARSTRRLSTPIKATVLATNAQRLRNLSSGLTARRDGDTLVTKKEPTSMPNVYLHCTPKGRLTGRYKFDHGGAKLVEGTVDPEGLTDQPEVDESILLARVTMAEGGYTLEVLQALEFEAKT